MMAATICERQEVRGQAGVPSCDGAGSSTVRRRAAAAKREKLAVKGRKAASAASGGRAGLARVIARPERRGSGQRPVSNSTPAVNLEEQPLRAPAEALGSRVSE